MDIAYAPSNPDTVYLGVDTSQVWKSVDGGQSWAPSNGGYKSIGSRSLLVHPDNENIVFSAGTIGAHARQVNNVQPYQGIYRSLDGGKNWQMQYETGFFKQDSRGQLFALDSSTLKDTDFTIYAGTYRDGLLVSTDSGSSWRSTGFTPGQILDLLELYDKPGEYLVASQQGLFHFDGEVSRKVGEGLPGWPRSIATGPSTPNVILAAIGDKGIYRSEDQGLTFTRSNITAFSAGVIADLQISHVDAAIALATGSGRAAKPFYSSNNGVRFRPAKSINSRGLTEGGGFYFPSPLAMHPGNSQVALTSSNGRARVLRTEDAGKHWFYSSSGYLGARLGSATFLSADEIVFNLTDHGPWRSKDNGQSFAAISVPRLGGRSVSDSAFTKNAIVLAVGTWHDKHLMVSHSGGKSWSNTGLRGRFELIEAHRQHQNVIYAGPYRSDDEGRSWKKLSHEIVTVSPHNSDTVYALRKGEKAAQVMVSNDRGDTWHNVGKPIPMSSQRINQLAADPFKEDRLYAAAAGALWVLGPQGWQQRTKMHGMLPDTFGGMYVANVTPHPSVPGLLFAGRRSPFKGMGNGLFYSTDHGDTWQQLDNNLLSNTNIWAIAANPHNGEVFVGTAHGIYRLTPAGVSAH